MRQAVEAYYAGQQSAALRCSVSGCTGPVAFEVFDGDYAAALGLLRGRHREKVTSRRAGDERIYACRKHLEDENLKVLRWQLLMFEKEGQL